ncbi:MAG: hypothetical protein KAS32_02565 [Candidatus Peribacteraceae bacterium]|nr:hypothetical protein [Candidatus Peribacteraceae bacterium]
MATIHLAAPATHKEYLKLLCSKVVFTVVSGTCMIGEGGTNFKICSPSVSLHLGIVTCGITLITGTYNINYTWDAKRIAGDLSGAIEELERYLIKEEFYIGVKTNE